MTKLPQESWEKEFDKVYSSFEVCGEIVIDDQKLKSFIQQTLTSDRQRVVEEMIDKIEERRKHINIFNVETGNMFKDDVIEIIKSLKNL